MKLLVTAAAVAATLASLGCGSNDDDVDIKGKWQGTLTENTGEKFKIALDITELEAGKQAATVAYPDLGSAKGCSGVWTYTGKNGTLYKFDEKITEGRNSKCFGTGVVSITPNDEDHLSYGWRSGQNQSAGTLSRE